MEAEVEVMATNCDSQSNHEGNCDVTTIDGETGSINMDGDCDVTNGNEDSSVTNCDGVQTESEEDVSLCSFEYETVGMGGVEERASSSLSTTSRGSRIPRFTRSASLREKSCRPNVEFNLSTSTRKHQQRNVTNIGGLYRSSSFVANSGISGECSSGSRNATPITPEPPRRRFPFLTNSYVSPYSRKAIAAERKTQSHAGVPAPREKEPHFTPLSLRRTSQPLMSNTNTPITSSCHTGRNALQGDLTPEEDDDNFSEKSFGSVSSAHSCDVTMGIKRTSGGFWGSSRRPRSILHCSHAHNQDPDDYLTPTQRAARKIRELQAHLKKARSELAEKDAKITALTRDLVQLRMDKAGNDSPIPQTDEEKKMNRNGHTRRKDRRSYSSLPSPNGESPPPTCSPPHCLTPNSEDGELRLMGRKRRDKTNEGPLTKAGDSCVPSRHSPAVASVGGDSDSGELSRSLADSGHYEDLPSPSMSSRDSLDAGFPSIRKIISSLYPCDEGGGSNAMMWAAINAAEEGLRMEWMRRIEDLKTNHVDEYHELKERHNDKVEMLLSKLSEANLKYFELRPQHDKSQEKARELEKEVERLKDELRESEIRQQKVYLQMYLKGQQAAKLDSEDKMQETTLAEEIERRSSLTKEFPDSDTQRNMIFSLMKQLAQSEDEIQRLKLSHSQERRGRVSLGNRKEEIDPEITLQFLKSAIYYFLTDRDNSAGHLRAIESILGYSNAERGNINRNYRY